MFFLKIATKPFRFALFKVNTWKILKVWIYPKDICEYFWKLFQHSQQNPPTSPNQLQFGAKISIVSQLGTFSPRSDGIVGLCADGITSAFYIRIEMLISEIIIHYVIF